MADPKTRKRPYRYPIKYSNGHIEEMLVLPGITAKPGGSNPDKENNFIFQKKPFTSKRYHASTASRADNFSPNGLPLKIKSLQPISLAARTNGRTLPMKIFTMRNRFPNHSVPEAREPLRARREIHVSQSQTDQISILQKSARDSQPVPLIETPSLHPEMKSPTTKLNQESMASPANASFHVPVPKIDIPEVAKLIAQEQTKTPEQETAKPPAPVAVPGAETTNKSIFVTGTRESEHVTTQEVKGQHVTTQEVNDHHVTTQEVKDQHVTIQEVKDQHVTTQAVNDHHVTTQEVKDQHVTIQEVKDQHVTTQEVKDQHLTTQEVKDQHVTTQEVKKELTPEEKMLQAAGEILEANNRVYQNALTIPQLNEDGSCSKKFVRTLFTIQSSYHSFRDFPLEILENSRDKSGKYLTNSGFVPIVCDFIVAGLKTGRYKPDESNPEDSAWVTWNSAQKEAFTVIWNFTDCCRDVVTEVNKHESLFATMIEKLREWYEPYANKTLNKYDDRFLIIIMNILHNVAMQDVTIPKLRELQTTDILLKYLNSSSDLHKLLIVATLADVMTEKEADSLAATHDITQFLLRQLRNALNDKKHRYMGYSVTELVRAVRQLARNDSNKLLLVREGALPLLTKGAQSTYLPERNVCLEAVWVLSFKEENRREIMNDETLLDLVVRIYRDNSLNDNTRKLSHGILWQLRHELMTKEKYAYVAKDFVEKPEQKKAAIGSHVMMSYQREDRELILQICRRLRSTGHKVWVDVDSIKGSTVQAMAEAIEQAFVVVCCMSQKYKDSPNCRAEAEYAFQKRKKIVPLLMQKGYEPDGWLGIIMGAKTFYDFTGKYTFESRITGLLKELQACDEDVVDGPTEDSPTEASTENRTTERHTSRVGVIDGFLSTWTSPSVVMEKLQTWTRDDVQTWLKKFDLIEPELESLAGSDIVFLVTLHSEAPEFFYKTLEKKLKIQTLSSLKTFMSALKTLPSLLSDTQENTNNQKPD